LYKSILAARDVANRKRHFAAVERQMMCANPARPAGPGRAGSTAWLQVSGNGTYNTPL